MRRPRLALAPPILAPGPRVLGEAERHYLRDVLRLGDGAQVTVFDGQGGEWDARLARDGEGRSLLLLGERLPDRGADPRLSLVLVQALTHTRDIDEVLARVTEIGAEAVVPVLAARGRIRLDPQTAARRGARWQAILAGAARQCGRTRLPVCLPPRPLPDYLAGLPPRPPDELRILLSPEAPFPLAGDAAQTPARVVVMVGPEGGWSPEEKAMAERAGFAPRRLGPRVLRTGTAGLAALTAAGLLWGDLAD